MSSEQSRSESVLDDAGAGGGAVRDQVPRRRIGLVAVIAVLVLAADLLTKIVVVSNLEGREPLRVLGGAVYLQLVRNSGAAFSIATGATWLLALLAVAIVIALIWLARRLRSVPWAIGLGLILAGALGNLSDRIFRAPGPLRGHVIDFVSLFGPNGEYWPVFNVADSAICVGAVLVVLLTILGKDYDGGVGQRISNTPADSSSTKDKE